jgi:hypothetical protein
MTTEMVFENPTDLAELIGDNFIVETLFDELVFRHVGATENGVMVVVARQTVIDYIAAGVEGMARDVARFAGEERLYGDAVTVGYSVAEAARALDQVCKSTAKWFYILPE